MTRKYLPLIPFILLLAAILVFYLCGYNRLLTFEAIKHEHLKWQEYVDLHPVLSALYFVVVYVVSVLLVIPDATILTILAGFLFPLPLAIIYCIVAETIGATGFFLTARAAFPSIEPFKKWLPYVQKWDVKFRQYEIHYLLFLRLSHLLPFWIVNLAAGIFQVRTSVFIWTTFVGVLPLVTFLAIGGQGLAHYFLFHTHFAIREIFTLNVKIALIGLACLSLLPLLYVHFFKKKN